jgi:predicted O-linked N-acetylglucosamine transferase (SPINDLY family)
VIGNFNNWKKFDPDTIALWGRVMRHVPASVLWLMSTLPYAGPTDSLHAVLRCVRPAPLILTVKQ